MENNTTNPNTKSTEATQVPQSGCTKKPFCIPEWKAKFDKVSWECVTTFPKKAYDWSKEKMITAGKKIYRKEEKSQ